ncbi:hypothetical protein MKW98_027468 [Papaver atlanticum]|uniref:Uncharacterized protein n=1 Tax=Papaver atlanticum TaxID=357466 RepID=A0AAD4X3H9_9MAGN|nr:hypothetical protein MKW98_027468 [Papaver atlanticum]
MWLSNIFFLKSVGPDVQWEKEEDKSCVKVHWVECSRSSSIEKWDFPTYSPLIQYYLGTRVVAHFVVEWKSGWIYDACISRPTLASQRVLEDFINGGEPNKMLLHHLKDHCQVVHTLPKLLLQGILP